MSALIHITSSEQFQQEIAYNGLTIVDFYADRCGPCKMLSPIMEELQADNAAKGVKILKVNIDEQPKLTSDFWVTSVPTVFFMKNGELQEGLAGASPKQVYQEKIDEYLA